MWVKICANTSLEDARCAIDAGADAVGFVFAAGSKRRITGSEVSEIIKGLPAAPQKIGVFVEHSGEEIAQIVRATGLTGVQMLSGEHEDALENIQQLRGSLRDLPRPLMVLQVVHFQGVEVNGIAAKLAMLSKSKLIDAVVLDSRIGHTVGGTGVSYDWNAARLALSQAALDLKLIVAGGLTPETVRSAITTLSPWGVDVASGVEARPGKKDFEKVKKFVSAAREAALGMETSARTKA